MVLVLRGHFQWCNYSDETYGHIQNFYYLKYYNYTCIYSYSRQKVFILATLILVLEFIFSYTLCNSLTPAKGLAWDSISYILFDLSNHQNVDIEIDILCHIQYVCYNIFWDSFPRYS